MNKFLLFSVFFYCSCSFAQISFDKGYFIDNMGNRTDCYIKNMDWQLNPTEFKYKTTAEDSNIKKETIATVAEFGVGNSSKYQRFSVLMERSGTNLNNLGQNKEPVFKKETLFLKVLVEGDAILYNYSEVNLTRFFHQTKNVPLEQLICIEYMGNEKNDDDESSYGLMINKAFRRQLYANERCAKFSDADFENLEYQETALVKHFKKFNSCNTNKEVSYEVKDRPKSFNIKAVASIGRATVDIKDQNIYFNKSTDISKTAIKIGLEAEWVLPFNKNKWSIFLNPMYQKFNAEKTYVLSDNNPIWPQDVEHHAHVDYSSIELALGIRHYMFLGKNSRLFIDAAFAYDLMGNSTITLDNTEFKSKTGGCPMFGIGYSFKKKISLELRGFTNKQLMGYYLSWSTTYNAPGIVFAYTVF